MLTRATGRFFFIAALALPGIANLGHRALAQDSFQGASMSAQTAAAMGAAPERPEDHAIPIAGWLVYPSFTLGYTFNDNVFGRPFNRIGASGVRVRPSFEALRENGLHRTMAYVDADFQAYPGLGASERYVAFQKITDAAPTNVAGHAGLQHVWQPLEDLTVRASVDATRQTGLFPPYYGSTAGQETLPNAFSFSSVQQYVNQFSGALAVEKKIGDRGFVRSTTTAFYTSYDNRPLLSSPSSLDNFLNSRNFGGNFQNGYGFRQTLRAGIWVTPQIYAFAEPGLDLRRYNRSAYDTNGYRVQAGLGSDMLSLFRGEIYGGYQSQASVNGLLARTSAPAYGARLFYYPTRDLTLSISADQTLSSTSAPLLATGVTEPFWHVGGARWASAARTRQFFAQAEYAISPRLSTFLRGGYGDTRFSSPGFSSFGFSPGSFSTTAFSAGGGLNYQLWRNLSVSVDYQFLKTRLRAAPIVQQNIALAGSAAQGFSRNVVSVGLNWRF